MHDIFDNKLCDICLIRFLYNNNHHEFYGRTRQRTHQRRRTNT
jgi:hypothetical protein